MGRWMHKTDKVAGLLLTAGKVNSFLQKAQISSLCLRRSSALVLLFVVLLLCAHWMGSLVPSRSLKQPCIGPVGWRPTEAICHCWADSWSWIVLFSESVGCWASSQVTEVCEHCININASYVWKLHQVSCMITLMELKGWKTSGSRHLHDAYKCIYRMTTVIWKTLEQVQ